MGSFSVKDLESLRLSGLMTSDEARKLYELASAVPSNTGIVEIGNYLGLSTLYLYHGSAKNQPRILSIDPHDYRLYDRVTKKRDNAHNIYLRNLERYGVNDRVEVIPHCSHDVVFNFSGNIGLLFIDGDHSYEAVLRDYRDWGKFVVPGGVIALHDVGDDSVKSGISGPTRFFKERIARYPDKYVDIESVGSLTFFKKVG